MATSLKILMFPWLAFGHISPFLEVAKKLCDRGFDIYLCSTPVNIDSIKKKITQKYSFSLIQLVELHLPNLPELPPSLHTTNGLPPHLMTTLRNALREAKPELFKILRSLKPDLVIHDVLQPWMSALASRHNIPALRFSTMNAAAFSYFLHMAMKPGIEFPFPAIHLSPFELARLVEQLESAKAEIKEKDPEVVEFEEFSNSFLLVRSSREIDGKYMDYLSELLNSKVVPVCPVISQDQHQQQSDTADEELIQWLGKKTERSSVFVSFGSEYFLNKQEMEEIAFGLELSNVNFIWVLRFPKGEDTEIEEALPEGFLERVKDRGRIVQGWAPQTKILGHPSIGGFVSHCGWNSVLETIEIGVPIIAMPMNLDQPFNARVVVENGVGIEVMRDENGKLKREAIAQVIKDVVMERTGENLRKKASDLNQKLKDREKKDFDGLVEVLKQLCD